MLFRRCAALAALTLIPAGMVAPAAQASASQHRLHGIKVEIRRAPTTGTSRSALRQSTRIQGSPAAHKTSTWQVTYDAGFNANAPAKAAFQAAVDIWAGIVTSSVPIRVDAKFTVPDDPDVLGSAGPDGLFQDGAYAYPDALADARKGFDLDPGNPDIDAEFNKNATDVYYGTDGNPASNQIDFESIVIHELGHGLGFTGSADYDSGVGQFSVSPPLIYDHFTADSAGTSLTSLPNNSTTLGSAFTNNAVYWSGPKGIAANGSKPRLYAPNPWSIGSSIAHLDEDAFPMGDVNSLMTPYISNNEVVHRPGPVIIAMMQDIGWTAKLGVPDVPTSVSASDIGGAAQVTWNAPSENGSPIQSYTIQQTDSTTGTTTSALHSGTSTSYTSGALTDGDSYTYKVLATNLIGSSAYSAASNATSPTVDSTAPTAAFVNPTAYRKATASVAFTGTDPDRPNAALTYTCSLDAAAPVACTSPFAYSNLTGAHTLDIKAKDVSGNEQAVATTTSFTIDATPPTVALTGAPANPTKSATAAFTFTGTDDIGPVTFLCVIDSGAASQCNSGKSYPSLSDGVHTFKVASVDEAGNVSPVVSDAFRVDTVAPTVRPTALPLFSLVTSLGFHYAGVDSNSGTASYDVLLRKAPLNGAFGAYSAIATGTTASVVSVSAAKGYTYCFVARAHDRAGNVGGYSAPTCTAIAIDDRSLSATTGGWTRGSSAASYAGTVTSAAGTGRTLTRTGSQARHLGIVATTCRGCGTVGVYWNGRLVKTISLNASSTTYRRVITAVDLGSVQSGTLVIKTLNGGRAFIDGAAFSHV